MTTATHSRLKVADEVWIATLLLHREHPDRRDFSIDEIVERARRENIYGSLRPGFYVHTVQHCVANRSPNPARYRMLFETGSGRRRLFRSGDVYHPKREGGKTMPEVDDMPYGYSGLLGWYLEWNQESSLFQSAQDGILALVGSGKEIWAEEHADDFVHRLREGWQ